MSPELVLRAFRVARAVYTEELAAEFKAIIKGGAVRTRQHRERTQARLTKLARRQQRLYAAYERKSAAVPR